MLAPELDRLPRDFQVFAKLFEELRRNFAFGKILARGEPTDGADAFAMVR